MWKIATVLNVNIGVYRHCETKFSPPGFADHLCINNFGYDKDLCTPLCLHWEHILIIILQHTKT